MKFRKMVMITLYAKQKKRHRCTEQNFGPCGRRRGWDVLREQHWNMYIIYSERDHQPRLDAWDKCSGLVHWEDPEELGGEGGGLGWGIHVNPWPIHVNIWQKPLQYKKKFFPSIRVFSNESVLHIRWATYWSFSFSISPSNEYSGLISFRMDWLDLRAVQGTLKSLL